MELKHTPLHAAHVELGARMVPFAGFDMPVQYSGIVEEHLAVRQAAGIFDVSHMGEFFIEGSGSTDLIDLLVTQGVRTLTPGRARYTVMLRDHGGIVDDLLVYRLAEERWMMVVNAANIEKDFTWIRDHAARTHIENRSEEIALIAIQGPTSQTILQPFLKADLSSLKYYHFVESQFNGISVLCSRTGYTGENGYEIYVGSENARQVWDLLLDQGQSLGLKPCGLGARDTLRLEAGMLLYGNDMNEDTLPFDVGLDWVVQLEKGPFIGREALLRAKEQGRKRSLVGFELTEPGIARHGYEVLDLEQRHLGMVTSGTMAPFLKKNIGFAFLETYPPPETFLIDIRSKKRRARISPAPFYKRTS